MELHQLMEHGEVITPSPKHYNNVAETTFGPLNKYVPANDNVPRANWRTDLTRARLKQVLHYDPVTGVFVRLETTSANAIVGHIAGWVDKDGYVRISVDGFEFPAHRLAWLYMTGDFPPEDVDHENGVRSDNRFSNLREASRSQNNMNQKRRSDNRTGFKGVGLHSSGLYRARIKLPGFKPRTIGYFDRAEDAHDAYIAAAAEHFQNFARAS